MPKVPRFHNFSFFLDMRIFNKRNVCLETYRNSRVSSKVGYLLRKILWSRNTKVLKVLLLNKHENIERFLNLISVLFKEIRGIKC